MSHSRETRALAAELKFLIDPVIAPRIQSWARTFLPPDPHGLGPESDEYEITTVYFDTQDLAVLGRRNSFGRAKYRLRRYGNGDFVFLERKLRRPGVLVKRRTRAPLSALTRLKEPVRSDWPGCWFHRRLALRALNPACQVAYHRMARERVTAYGPARLTLDRRLRAMPVNDTQLRTAPGTPVLDDRVILELKYRVELPGIFKQLVEEFALTPVPASKYRLAMVALGQMSELLGETALTRDGAWYA